MKIRKANKSDSSDISKLMAQLGYPVTPEIIDSKLVEFEATPIDTVFLAELDGRVVGSISCHITSLLHQEGSSGRITSLVIDKECRKMGIGKLLVQEAEDFFIKSGCVKSEVTSGDHRSEAHLFYESCGYELDERRYLKKYS